MCQFQATPYAADLMQKLSITEQQYASIATGPMLSGLFVSFISGTLGDKFGVKKTVFVAIIISTIGALSRAFTTNYGVLLVVSVLMGVAGMVVNSNNAKFMSTWFSPQQRAIAIGFVLSSGNAGTLAAMAIGKSLSPDVSKAFMYGGIAFAVLAVLWLILARENKNAVNAPAPEEQVREMPKVRITDVLKSRYTWIAAVGAALFMAVNMTVSALLSPGLVARGVSDGAAGLTVIIFSIVAIFSTIVMPGVIAGRKNTKTFCALLSVISGITMFLAWKTDSAAIRNIMIIICGIAFGGLISAIMSVPAFLPEIGPSKMGTAGGLITTVMMAGAFLIPSYVITPLAGGINDMTFVIGAVCAFILAVLFLILPNISVRQRN